MLRIGIMQGRLTQPKNRGIQFFPFDEWKQEFVDAVKIGISEIEWIFDYPSYKNNPLFTSDGCTEIVKSIEQTGVMVNAICWDYFMKRPFYKNDEWENILDENKRIFKICVEGMNRIGAKLIEIPLVDNSSVTNYREKALAISFLQWCADFASEFGIIVGLESDFPPGDFRAFIESICRQNVVANYDSGNSSGLGYDSELELGSLQGLVYNVHIKDRLLNKSSVPLGTGNADFDKLFFNLRKIDYSGSYILQAARGEEGQEIFTIMEQMKFVKDKYCKYYIHYGS